MDELAARQGVRPVQDLDALGAQWPENDDPDRLLEFVLGERVRRRST